MWRGGGRKPLPCGNVAAGVDVCACCCCCCCVRERIAGLCSDASGIVRREDLCAVVAVREEEEEEVGRGTSRE